jgi:phospholipid-binding lipoprotein MlaA|tara:strand:+ start:44 stop:826 length:783 start_codon:yes stop_codon:yes gene_type:complete
MIRIFGIIILSLFIATSPMAGSDGQNELSKDTNGQVKDCFEKVNRGIFAFNQAIDGLIFEPLAAGYRHLPSPIRTGTSNFIGNVSTLLTIPNNILQGDIGIAGKNTLRFVVNTTIGIVGLFDPASAIGLNSYEKEDFGQTLGSWGVGEGCYVVLPVLGPSTARDAMGSFGNYMGGDTWYNVTVRNDTHYFSDFDYYASKGVGGVDFRAKNFDDINNLEENSIDFYASVKSLYLQDRRKKILNASGATQTQNDSDWEEIDD